MKKKKEEEILDDDDEFNSNCMYVYDNKKLLRRGFHTVDNVIEFALLVKRIIWIQLLMFYHSSFSRLRHVPFRLAQGG